MHPFKTGSTRVTISGGSKSDHYNELNYHIIRYSLAILMQVLLPLAATLKEIKPVNQKYACFTSKIIICYSCSTWILSAFSCLSFDVKSNLQNSDIMFMLFWTDGLVRFFIGESFKWLEHEWITGSILLNTSHFSFGFLKYVPLKSFIFRNIYPPN